ncbi:hypothetical protein M404DRAFT_638821 [Pisolithus tinctorius Marx 270]|uniref:Methyltransferase domain-containing protein n=1 Tax=Pisolithus tinctorius Marx 270 TaxID=870435 RepID=A0A0C3NP48_PISTI|nr:hypothetical protein M404DRAFT_638821 [Pisolithus tinctorius Marx 270]
MPLLPILPIFPSRDSFSSSPASPPKQSFSDTSMLAVPLLHPFAAHQGSPSKREQPRQSNQSDAASSGQSSLHKHRSKFALPLISGPSHPPPPVPFPVQHTSLSNNLLTSPSCVQIPSLSTPPTSPFSSPPRSLQCPSATPSSSLLPASRHSQDSLSDASPLTAMSCDPHSVPFRLRGPLGYPLFGLPVAAAVEIHQPPSVATRPRPSSMHGKRAKSAVRSTQSPRSAPLSDAEDEDPRHQTIGVASTKPLRAAPDASYSLCSSSVLNPHGGLDSSRRRHHHFRQEAVPYPRNYERSVLDLDAWDNLWLRQACKSVTFHKFKDGEYPQRVLDVGCGSGTWVLECAAAWKESTFVGLDIVPIQPDLSRLPGSLSERISWVYANFLERLPFSSEEFDFVHIKRIARGVPEDMWDNLLEELARVMKPGAALEIIEEDLTFPGRPLDADDSSETRSSSSTIGCEEILPRNDRHAQKRDVERVRDLCGPSSVTKTEPQDLSLSFARIFSPLSASPEGVEASVLSEGRGRASEQTPFPGITNGQDGELPTLPSIKRSRSLTISSQRPKPQNPWAPQTPGNRKRPTTANSAPPQSASRSESQVNLRMAMAVKAAASCLSLSGKRPRSKKYPPMMGPLSGPSCASSTSIATTTVAGNTPTLYSSSCYDSTSTSSVPSPPPLLPPPKRNVDAAAKATLMETTAPNYLMMPYPGVRMAAAGKNPADLLSKDNDKTSAGLGRAGTGSNGANPGEGTIPENPRDHTVLETIYNEMHADRFVNLTPLSLLGNALGLWFKDVRTHEPIVLRFPPPPEELKCNPRASNVILSAADLMQGKSPYAGVDDAQFAISPGKASISLASGARQPTTAMTSNGLMMEVDLRTLNLHLAIRVKEILGCAEAMWDWVVEYQTKTEEGEREPGGVYAIISELSRAEFDELLAKFELDMEEHMAFGRILEDRLGWSTNPDSVPHDRRVFHDKWRAYLKSAGCAGVIPHPSTRWSRSVRAFIAWKPPSSATEHRTKIDPGAI